MPKNAFTDRFVAGVRVETRTAYFDQLTRGLVLRVAPTGAKIFSFVYRCKGSAPEWDRLGTYPALSLADARKLAHQRRAEVDRGNNPAAARRAAATVARPAVFTFNDLADVFAVVAAGQKKTWRDDVAKIKKYLRPAWGAMPLRSVTRVHVHELLDGLVAAGLTIGVNRLQAVVSRLFTIAVDRSLIDAHPCARMQKRFKENPADRVLTDDELRALVAGLDARPGRAADAVRLRLLLGQRGEEIAGMTWAEVDLDTGVWSMPGQRTKNGHEHAVPLPPSVTAVLVAARAALPADELRVFPRLTLRGEDYRNLATIHGGQYQWKDLRRTVATRLAELGHDETTIGRVLNHAKVSVTAKHYNQHGYLEEKRRALTAWDIELQRIVANAPKTGAAILPMRRPG